MKAPVDGVVEPIGPGAACKFTKPVPDIAEETLNVVNDPVDAVVEPIGGGLAR